jgi:hypothetical protein
VDVYTSGGTVANPHFTLIPPPRRLRVHILHTLHILHTQASKKLADEKAKAEEERMSAAAAGKGSKNGSGRLALGTGAGFGLGGANHHFVRRKTEYEGASCVVASCVFPEYRVFCAPVVPLSLPHNTSTLSTRTDNLQHLHLHPSGEVTRARDASGNEVTTVADDEHDEHEGIAEVCTCTHTPSHTPHTHHIPHTHTSHAP